MVAAIGFLAFVIYELTEAQPIVDLRIFRHRGFTAAAVTFAGGFAAFFASVVILPLWLQQNMGYTATWAGYATGIMGLLAFVSAPIVGKATERFDPRAILSIGILGLGAMTAWRMTFNSDVTFLQMAWPTLLHRTVHGDVLRAGDRPCHCQRHARGTGQRRRPLQLHAHAGRRLRHLAGSDRMGELGARQPVRAGQRHAERRPGGRRHDGRAALRTRWRSPTSAASSNNKACCSPRSTCSRSSPWSSSSPPCCPGWRPKPRGPIDTSGAH